MPAPVASELLDALVRLMPLLATPYTGSPAVTTRVEFGGDDDDDYFVQSSDYHYGSYIGDRGVRMLSGYTNRFHIDGTVEYTRTPNAEGYTRRYGRVEISTYSVGPRRRPAFSKAQVRLLRQHGFEMATCSQAEWAA